MEIGIGLGITRFPGWGVMNIGQLFASGEQGAWYDPSDMSTLFQDSAGTTPVTAVEQPVGRILDKSGRGNHATQATTTKRPIYSRRVNLLTKTEQFSDAVWAKNSGTTVSDRKVISGTTSGYQGINCSIAVAVGSEYITSCRVRAAGYTGFTISDGAFSRFAFTFDLTSGGITESRGSGYASATITSAGSGEFVVTVRSTFAHTVYYARFSGNPGNTAFAAGAFFTGDGVSGVEVWDVGVTLATAAHLPYQYVNTDTDYDADPAKYPAYLRFDGVDDALQTGNIDFTGTDKMTVWAGVNNPGLTNQWVVSIGLLQLFMNSSGYDQLRSHGTTSVYAGSSPPKFGGCVLTALGDISAPRAEIRVDGVSKSVISTSQGTGNYINGPMSIGVNGANYAGIKIYSLIVRGAQSSLSQIEATELYVKQKMRMP